MNYLKLPLIIFFISCGPQYVQDPNASVFVTSKYEDEPEKIISNYNGCKPQLDCTNKSEIECAAALYKDSHKFMDEGEDLTEKKLYISAKLEYMQALSRLIEAEIRVDRAKISNFDSYKKAIKLEKNIKKYIDFCQKKLYYLKWR